MKAKPSERRLKNKPAIYDRILRILESARSSVTRSVNTSQVVANWLIGRRLWKKSNKERSGPAMEIIDNSIG